MSHQRSKSPSPVRVFENYMSCLRIADVVAQITVQMHTEQTLFGQTIQDARSFFNALDHDRTGALDRGELKQGLKRLGIAMPSYLLDALLGKMDTNQNGLIEMKEVQRTFRPEPLDESKVKELRRRSIELGLTLREANAVSPEELQELLEGDDLASPASGDAIAAQLKRELLEKERLLEEARKEIEREKAQRAAEVGGAQAVSRGVSPVFVFAAHGAGSRTPSSQSARRSQGP